MSRSVTRGAHRVTAAGAIAASAGVVLAICDYPRVAAAFFAAAIVAATIVLEHLLNLEDRR